MDKCISAWILDVLNGNLSMSEFHVKASNYLGIETAGLPGLNESMSDYKKREDALIEKSGVLREEYWRRAKEIYEAEKILFESHANERCRNSGILTI